MKDWEDNKDFIIETFIHPNCGAYCNKQDLENEVKKTGKPIPVTIRYKKLTQVHVFKVE